MPSVVQIILSRVVDYDSLLHDSHVGTNLSWRPGEPLSRISHMYVSTELTMTSTLQMDITGRKNKLYMHGFGLVRQVIFVRSNGVCFCKLTLISKQILCGIRL